MRFIDAHRERFGVEPTCKVLRVSVATYYARRQRPPSRRALLDAELVAQIRAVHAANDGVYGSRRVWKALRRQGAEVARCTIEHLMREHRIEGPLAAAKAPGHHRRRVRAPTRRPGRAPLLRRASPTSSGSGSAT